MAGGIPCANNHEMEIKERGEAGRMVTKVHKPTLTVYQPKAGLANGTGVVICPGGGYYLLAWDKEGIKMPNGLIRSALPLLFCNTVFRIGKHRIAVVK